MLSQSQSTQQKILKSSWGIQLSRSWSLSDKCCLDFFFNIFFSLHCFPHQKEIYKQHFKKFLHERNKEERKSYLYSHDTEVAIVNILVFILLVIMYKSHIYINKFHIFHILYVISCKAIIILPILWTIYLFNNFT